MLRATMGHADAWNAWYNDFDNQPEGVPALRTLVDDACRDVGRDPTEVERTVALLVRLPGGTGRVQGNMAHSTLAPLAASLSSWPNPSEDSHGRGSRTSNSCSTRSPSSRFARSHRPLWGSIGHRRHGGARMPRLGGR